ncbi:MAG TPA: hypothetical protein PLE92_02290 [Lentisphaeria bacterium]|nr:hypothetical protein [Lentisphaerota bacterium]OQC13437.1 MAG: hypothetical protein BWX73_02372 [Lentisphaerae bacterium ADurb.Bin082]HQC51935.1 hypothetical protein [Lentisphaeria bacterium]HQL87632.1 hypothetical protein [Lentisphaeria bacterium]
MTKKRNQNDSYMAFDGRLTPEIRQRLRAKRYELGLPFQRVAAFFGVNWSTFRKWEQGPTESCELCYRPRLEAFLNGEYDSVLRSLALPKATVKQEDSQDIPQEVMQCLERVSNAYRLCQTRPDLREKIVRRIDRATAATMAGLISPPGQTRFILEDDDDE